MRIERIEISGLHETQSSSWYRRIIMFARFLIISFISIFYSGCTLISVTSMLKNDYGPAMMKGDISKIQANSTPEFAKLFNYLTPAEVKMINNFGNTGKGKGKAPKQGYDSFKTKGNRGVLTVKAGKSRMKFMLVKIDGDWKVDDLIIKAPKMRISYRDALGIFIAFKMVWWDLKHGKVNEAHTGKTLASELPVLAAFFDGFDEKSHSNKLSKPIKMPFKLSGFNIATDKKGGTITVSSGFFTATCRLSRDEDQWKLLDIQLDIKGRQKLVLTQILPFFQRIGHLISSVKSSNLEKSVQSFMEMWPEVKDYGDMVLRFARRLKKSGKQPSADYIPQKAGSFDPAILSHLKWDITPQLLSFNIGIKDFALKAALKNNGTIDSFSVNFKGIYLNSKEILDFLSTASDFRKTDLATPEGRSEFLRNSANLLTDRWSSPLLKSIPLKINFPLDQLEELFVSIIKNRSPGKSPTVKPDGTQAFTLENIKKTSDVFDVAFKLKNQLFKIHLRRVRGKWKIDTVLIDQEDILRLSLLLPSLLRFSEGLYTMDAAYLTSSFDDLLGKRMEHGLKELFRLQGKHISALGRGVVTEFKKRLSTSGISMSYNEKPSASKEDAMSLKVKDGFYILKTAGATVYFRQRKDGTLGMSYPPEIYEMLKRKKAFRNRDMFQMIEMLPLGVNMYFSVLRKDVKSLQAFMAPQFARKVLGKMTNADFARMLQKFKVQVPALTPKMVVDMVMDGAASEDKSKNRKNGAGGDLRLLDQAFHWRSKYIYAQFWVAKGNRYADVTFAWQKNGRDEDSGMWVLSEVYTKVPLLGRVKISDYAGPILSGKIPLPF
ncbi:hypothetical protein KKF34_14525 [Myxococcota bacterium]|nr:hypothetical protein [Myxococcota bacterium]MBU1383154.1 hypothetical protein [Myxococcota bacterium]MBU1498089.1 hypothetical protein [Myxococcota bacterium]